MTNRSFVTRVLWDGWLYGHYSADSLFCKISSDARQVKRTALYPQGLKIFQKFRKVQGALTGHGVDNWVKESKNANTMTYGR
jgi:hypothetical protein